MLILADLHTHVYPVYQIDSLFSQIYQKFDSIAQSFPEHSEHIYILALTERADCNFYQDLRAGKLVLPQNLILECLADCIKISKGNGQLLIFPGRQINTLERIELLSLGSDQMVAAGRSLTETLRLIEQTGAVPVINWAPGKWWFKRGQIIKSFIKNYSGTFLLGDTSLRPGFYPTPLLMSLAKSFNRRVIFGSDPLPHKKEQELIATYISMYLAEFDLNQPLCSFKKLLTEQTAQPLGQRSSLLGLMWRMFRYYRNGKC